MLFVPYVIESLLPYPVSSHTDPQFLPLCLALLKCFQSSKYRLFFACGHLYNFNDIVVHSIKHAFQTLQLYNIKAFWKYSWIYYARKWNRISALPIYCHFPSNMPLLLKKHFYYFAQFVHKYKMDTEENITYK